jgi:hypothetical protein
MVVLEECGDLIHRGVVAELAQCDGGGAPDPVIIGGKKSREDGQGILPNRCVGFGPFHVTG